eukprot:762633-Hanusia_phi.AAC.3
MAQELFRIRTLSGIRLEAGEEEGPGLFSDELWDLRGCFELGDLKHDGELVGEVLEGSSSGQHLQHRHAERPDVDVEGVSSVSSRPQHLRRDVVSSARDAHPVPLLHGRRDRHARAEVGELDDAVDGDEDVAGLEVAMDDAMIVQVPQPLEDLQAVMLHRLLRQRSEGMEDGGHGAARHVLHPDDGERGGDDLGGDVADNVGMVQLLQQLPLGLEGGKERAVCRFYVHPFDWRKRREGRGEGRTEREERRGKAEGRTQREERRGGRDKARTSVRQQQGGGK